MDVGLKFKEDKNFDQLVRYIDSVDSANYMDKSHLTTRYLLTLASGQ